MEAGRPANLMSAIKEHRSGAGFRSCSNILPAHSFSGDVSERVIRRLDVLGCPFAKLRKIKARILKSGQSTCRSKPAATMASYSNRMADKQALAFVYCEDGSGVREVLSVRFVRKRGLQDRGRTMSGLSIWSAPEFRPKMRGVGGLRNLFRSEFACFRRLKLRLRQRRAHAAMPQ
jgi:hypothetical protein